MGERQHSDEKSEEQYEVTDMVDLKGRPVDMATTGRWRAASFFVGYEVCERMSFFGIAANLVVYLTNELHEGTVQSARNVSNWAGTIWMTPILGAYIADTYLGRFWTFTTFCSVYIIGMALLTLAVSLPSLKPPPCDQAMKTTCRRASAGQVGFFYFALYLLCLGTGGTKPNISTMGADQFDERDPKEARLKHSFFNWWMFCICFGVVGAQTVLVYIQDNVSWGLGYGIPTILLLVSICIFMAGIPFYRHKKPTGSPLSEIAQVFTAAMLNWRVKLPETETSLYELDPTMYSKMGKIPLKHTDRYRWLDKAAVIRRKPSVMHPRIGQWRLCTVSQVEETKMVVGMIFVWLSTVLFSSIMSNVVTFFIKQGQTLDRHLGGSGFQLPPASLGCSLSISMIILVPVYDRFLVPFFRGLTGLERGLTLLQRAGIGILMQAPVMVVAAMVERRRLHIAAQYGLLDSPHATIPMTILWLVPQYLLIGLADTFTSIAILEFFYDQAPLGMKSIGTAIYTTNYGMGYFLSSLIITGTNNITSGWGRTDGWLVNNLNRCRLDYYYWFLALLTALNAFFFVIVARSYQYANHHTYTENRKTTTGDNSTS